MSGILLVLTTMLASGVEFVEALTIVLATGLLMVSNIRYPHLVNRYLRGKRPLARLVVVVILLLLLVVWHQYTLGIGMVTYAFYGFALWMMARVRRSPPQQPAAPVLPSPAPSR